MAMMAANRNDFRQLHLCGLAGLAMIASLLAAPLQPLAAANLPPSTAAMTPAEAAPADQYILGPGDRLELSFLAPAHRSLGGAFTLLADGSANLPLLGTVVFEGLTIAQANVWLQQLYGRTLRRPDLNLRLVGSRPLQVSVVGEVDNPGIYVLSPSGESSAVEGFGTGGGGLGGGGAIPGLPTLVTAIQKAGGLTLNANLADVRLQRRVPGGDPSQLKETSLSLLALLQQGDKRQNPFLFDGDTIVISRAPAPPPDEVLEIAAANLSPQQIRVNVVGEVKNPGTVALRAGTPLVQAVMAAGGPVTFRTDKSNIELIRLFRNGSVALRRFQLNYSLSVSGPFNPPLRDGDTIVVNRSGFARTTDALSAVSQPLNSLVGLIGIFSIIQNWNVN